MGTKQAVRTVRIGMPWVRFGPDRLPHDAPLSQTVTVPQPEQARRARERWKKEWGPYQMRFWGPKGKR
jgi:hypothetical protein